MANLILNSGLLDAASWVVSGDIILAPNDTASPGGNTFFDVTKASSGNRIYQQHSIPDGSDVFIAAEILKQPGKFARLTGFTDQGNGTGLTEYRLRVSAETGAILQEQEIVPGSVNIIDNGESWRVTAYVAGIAGNVRCRFRLDQSENPGQSASYADAHLEPAAAATGVIAYERTSEPTSPTTEEPPAETGLTQFAYDSANLLIGGWRAQGSPTITQSADPVAGTSDTYFNISGTNGSWYWVQDTINPGLAEVRASVQTKVKNNGGNEAAIRVWSMNTSSQTIEIIDVDFDLANQTATFNDNNGAGNFLSSESDASDSIFIESLGDNEYRIGMTLDFPAGHSRFILGLHRSSAGTAGYSHVNISANDADGLPDYVPTTDIHGNPSAADFFDNVDDVFNPTIHNDYAVWDGGEISDHAYDTQNVVANLAEFEAALAAAVAAPAQKHLIEWSVNDIAIDFDIDATADFIGNGGILVITTQNGEMLNNTGQLKYTGGDGVMWFNYKCSKEFNQYEIAGSLGNAHYGVWGVNGVWNWKDHQSGNGFEADGDPMYSCIGMYFTGSANVLIDRADMRNNTSAIRRRGNTRMCFTNSHINGVLEDELYTNNNDNTGTGEIVSTYTGNVATCSPTSFAMFFMTVNTRDVPWAVNGFSPFTEGEVVEQVTADGTFRGTIVRILLGDGVNGAPRMHTARNVAGDGLGWEGDLIYILADRDTSETYLHEAEVVTGLTSGATYTPQLTVKSGAASNFDAGIWLGIVHTDETQWGAGNDEDGTIYLNAHYAKSAVTSCPLGGGTQGAIPNYGPNPDHRNYERFRDTAITATRASDLSSTEYYCAEGSHTRAPLGDDWERAHNDPGIGYDGDVPQIVVNANIHEYGKKPIIRNTASSIRALSRSKITAALANDGDWYPYLFPVTEARSNATGTATGYDAVFAAPPGGFETYADNEIRERTPVIPYNATREQAMRLVHNWHDWYREPAFAGGFDYTTDLTESGMPPKGFFGQSYNPGRIPHIRFTEWYAQTIAVGDTYTPATFTATDGATDLTADVVVDDSAVDTSTPGIYFVSYTVSNPLNGNNSYTTYSYVSVEEGGTGGGTNPDPDPDPTTYTWTSDEIYSEPKVLATGQVQVTMFTDFDAGAVLGSVSVDLIDSTITLESEVGGSVDVFIEIPNGDNILLRNQTLSA